MKKVSSLRSLSQTSFFSSTLSRNVKTYTTLTYDAAFKWVLSDNKIRASFIRALVTDRENKTGLPFSRKRVI